MDCNHSALIFPKDGIYPYDICACAFCLDTLKGDEIPTDYEEWAIDDSGYRSIISRNPEPSYPNKMNIAPPESFPRGDYE